MSFYKCYVSHLAASHPTTRAVNRSAHSSAQFWTSGKEGVGFWGAVTPHDAHHYETGYPAGVSTHTTTRFSLNLRLKRGKYVLFIGGER